MVSIWRSLAIGISGLTQASRHRPRSGSSSTAPSKTIYFVSNWPFPPYPLPFLREGKARLGRVLKVGQTLILPYETLKLPGALKQTLAFSSAVDTHENYVSAVHKLIIAEIASKLCGGRQA
jgi:hypothetical protein